MIRSFQGITPQIAPTAYIDDSAQIIGDVVIGEHSSVWPLAVIRGDDHYIRIGSGSIVAAGAVVPVLPPGSLIMGLPGKVRRQLNDEDMQRIDRNVASYDRLKNQYMAERNGSS